MTDNVVVVEEINNVVVVQETVPTIVITSPGPQGPSGTSAAIFYTHTQATPSAVWTIDHNLNGHPTAVVLDSAGTMCEGTFTYPTTNQMVITFSSAFSGIAYII
jgi:hypothetical protein